MRIFPGLLAIVSMSGCGLMPDRSLEYQQAQTTAPLVLPAGDKRSIKPLYVIPEVTTVLGQAVVEGKGRKQRFVAPIPKPLLVANSSSEMKATTVGVTASKPQIVNDGNGHPLLQSNGDILQVWDTLNIALAAANIKVVDKNLSLGLYFIELSSNDKKAGYQLKVIRTSNDNVISLQKDDDTLVDSELSQQIFERLLSHWPS